MSGQGWYEKEDYDKIPGRVFANLLKLVYHKAPIKMKRHEFTVSVNLGMTNKILYFGNEILTKNVNTQEVQEIYNEVNQLNFYAFSRRMKTKLTDYTGKIDYVANLDTSGNITSYMFTTSISELIKPININDFAVGVN